jgi:hypothetical protein
MSWSSTTSATSLGYLSTGTNDIGNITVVVNSSSETEAGTKTKLETKKTPEGISPKLYFSYVKSKLSTLEKKKLQERLKKLQGLVVQSKELDQQAMYEDLSRMLAVVVRESEALAVGVEKFILLEHVEKFKSKVKDKVIKFNRLEEFIRPIPAKQRAKIKAIKDKKIFDELWILYVDYTDEKIKTNKEKIQEKDPVVFGKFAYAPDVLYFVCDWVDKYCDITLSKIVDTLKQDDQEFAPAKIGDIDEKFYSSIVSEVKTRHERLAITKRDNYRSLMAEEDKDRTKMQKTSLWKTIFSKFGFVILVCLGGVLSSCSKPNPTVPVLTPSQISALSDSLEKLEYVKDCVGRGYGLGFGRCLEKYYEFRTPCKSGQQISGADIAVGTAAGIVGGKVISNIIK